MEDVSTCFWDVRVDLDLVNVVPSGWAGSVGNMIAQLDHVYISEKWRVLRHVVVIWPFDLKMDLVSVCCP